MMKNRHILYLLFTYHYLLTRTFLTSPLNISHLLYSSAPHPDNPRPPHFLQDVLEAIAERKQWDVETIRVSKLEKVRIGYTSRHSFFVRVGKSNRDLIMRYSGKVHSWQELEVEDDFERSVKQVSSHAVLPAFKMEGPFVLFVDGDDDRLSLLLQRNTSFSFLRQIRVGEGITLEIQGAREVTFPLSFCEGKFSTGCSRKRRDIMDLWPPEQPFCAPLLPVRVVGLAHATAFSASTIKHQLLAKNVAKLRQDKSYARNTLNKPPCPVYLSSRISNLQQLLRKTVGEKIPVFRFLKTNIKAATKIKLQLELERDVPTEKSKQDRLAAWRTLPTVQRVRFDIVALHNFDGLKLLEYEQVRPFIHAYSTVWSNLLPNVSVTDLSNMLVRPRLLTLGVRW